MKRLRNYLLSMERTQVSYKEIYAGEELNPISGEIEYNPIYVHGDAFYHVQPSHRLTPDKPHITISLPLQSVFAQETDFFVTHGLVVADSCLRLFNEQLDQLNQALENRARPITENGGFLSFRPQNAILPRNACRITPLGAAAPPRLVFEIQVQLPRQNNKKAAKMLCNSLPAALEQFVLNIDHAEIRRAIDLHTKQQEIRAWMGASGYCAFIADGSVLPRTPEKRGKAVDAIPFVAPENLAVCACGVRGLGIKLGVTVITGGGYSGKSTLLDAIKSGIYDHIAGDGRELVLTERSAVEIFAEDGRPIRNLDITPFITRIPNADAANFSTDHASGSVSQAANILEAMDAQTSLLLIDEDKTATNFMYRDDTMRQLIRDDPIVPLIDAIRTLHVRHAVSTILVVGSCSAFLRRADCVLMMRDYQVEDIFAQVNGAAVHTCKEGGIEWKSRNRMAARHGQTTSVVHVPETRLTAYGHILVGQEVVDLQPHGDALPRAVRVGVALILQKLAVAVQSNAVDLSTAIEELLQKILREDYPDTLSNTQTDEPWYELPRACDVAVALRRMKDVVFLE